MTLIQTLIEADLCSIGFAKYETATAGQIQTDTPAICWYAGRLESTYEALTPGHTINI